ncbi:hypothetical protein FGIG_01024, partial [Fasciola gigantica]
IIASFDRFTEVKENSVTINFGDICATGNDDSWIEFTIKATESGTSSDSLIHCVALSGYHVLENSRIRYQFTRKEDKKVIKRLKREFAQDSEVMVTLFVSIRLSNCAEMKNGDNISVLVKGALGGEPAYSTIAIPVYRKEDTEKADLNLKMIANCSDVYPSDTVDISATISHSSESRAECDSITMVLHNGPWVSKVDLTSNGSEVLWNDNSDIRLFVQHVSPHLNIIY